MAAFVGGKSLPMNIIIPLLVQSTILKHEGMFCIKQVNLAVNMLGAQLIWEFRSVKTNLDLV